MMDFSGFCGKRICVALSGGVDSVALLQYLQEGVKPYGYFLSAVHIEHGIRGEESLRDMRFVQDLCKARGIELFVFRVDCPARAKTEKISLETAGRKCRYEKFDELIKAGKADYIALAHHQNDEAETVLFRMSRGASLTGVSGMREVNGYLLRPFLSWKKSEIIEYADRYKLAFCVDKTNFELCATRNKIRLEVLPALENAVPGAVENIARFASFAGEDDEFLYEQSRALLTAVEERRYIVAFCGAKPLFRRACLTALKNLGVEKDYTAVHLQDAFELQNAERGAYICLPKGVIAQKTLTGVAFYLEKDNEVISLEKPKSKPFSEEGFDGGRYEVKVSYAMPDSAQGEWKVLRIDAGKLPKNACFRFRREGDEIKRFGSGNKSLKKLFNEKKIPVQEREWLPLIAEENGGEVFAVCGVEIADELKITEQTERAVYLSVKRK